MPRRVSKRSTKSRRSNKVSRRRNIRRRNTRRRNTKRRNVSKRRNTKRRNVSKRRNTKRRNVSKRRNTKRRNTRRRNVSNRRNTLKQSAGSLGGGGLWIKGDERERLKRDAPGGDAGATLQIWNANNDKALSADTRIEYPPFGKGSPLSFRTAWGWGPNIHKIKFDSGETKTYPDVVLKNKSWGTERDEGDEWGEKPSRNISLIKEVTSKQWEEEEKHRKKMFCQNQADPRFNKIHRATCRDFPQTEAEAEPKPEAEAEAEAEPEE